MNTDKGKTKEGIYPEEELTEKILKCAFAVHNSLGAGFLERVYSNALLLELRSCGETPQQEVPFSVQYRHTSVGEYVADLIVSGRVLVELKASASLGPADIAQVLNYLRASGIRVGLLLNFGRPKLEYRRLVL